jgi:hypothetical protein
MVLFPFAFIWMIIVIVWVLRNETNKPDEERFWVRTKRWRPRRPGGPRGRPTGTAERRASSRRRARTDARAESRTERIPRG